MLKKAPGKAHRKGILLIELMERFPNEESAHEWFIEQRWGRTGCFCPRCGNLETSEKGMVFWCPSCRRRFSVRTGTPMERSKIPLRKWAIAIYLSVTSLKGVSSMKLHRDLGITQKSAWFMAHRIREAMTGESGSFLGPAEADKTYFGGKRKNMSNAKRKELAGTGRGAVGKTAVAGVKDRTTNKVSVHVMGETDANVLQGFVREHLEPGTTLYTDEAKAYAGMPEFEHEAVRHSVAEYVRGKAHTNGIESLWSMLSGYVGTYHKLSTKHLQRYMGEFAGRHNLRNADTADMMAALVAGMIGKRLFYSDLIADNGLVSGARS